MRVLFLVLFLVASSHVAAQATIAVGALIHLHGVHVRGFREGDSVPRIQSSHGVRISVHVARADGARHRGASTVHVCDVDAVRSEESFGATPSSRVQIRPDIPSAHLIVPAREARTYVRLAIPRTIEGQPRFVTIEWSVPTAQREARRALEDAFFASVGCDAPS
jgi:hypothetical protein